MSAESGVRTMNVVDEFTIIDRHDADVVDEYIVDVERRCYAMRYAPCRSATLRL